MDDHQLRRGSAGTVLLTGLGLAYIIVGNYVAWGFALASGGVGGLLVALLIVNVMFFCLVGCLAELGAMMPSAGGGFEFVRSGLGEGVGRVAGAAILLEYLCGTAALASFSADYVGALTGLSPDTTIVGLFVVVGLLHMWGVGEALSVTLIIALIAIAGILAFVVAMLPLVSWDRLLDIAPGIGGTTWFPHGWAGAWAALPFVVTFYITIEGVSFAAEEAKNPEKSIPRAMYAALSIAAVLALVVSIAGPAGTGASRLAGAPDPLVAALRDSGSPALLTFVNAAGVAGLTGSFFGGLFASSRLLFHLARSGLLPFAVARTNSRQAPWVAILAASAVGLVLALSANSAQLVVIFVAVATASYLLMLAAHASLRIRSPDAARPYRSPGGLLLPCLGILVGAVLFVACFLADVRFSTFGLIAIVVVTAALNAGARAARVPQP